MATIARALSVVVVGWLACGTNSAFAQGGPPDGEPSRVEVTPFVSLGSSFSSQVGGAVSFPWKGDTRVEVEAGYRNGGGGPSLLSSSVSLLYDLPRLGRMAPYLAGGAGLQQYGRVVTAPSGGPIMLAATSFTFNAGGGVKVPVDDQWGFRTDARWTKAVGGPEHWRLYNGVSLGVGRR